MKTLIAFYMILFSVYPLSAQQRPPNDSAGGPHAALQRFVGQWEAQARMWRSADSSVPPVEGVLTVSSEMVMGGRFLVEKVASQPPTRPFQSIRIVGYDNLTRRYEGATYDSQGTNIIRPVGKMNAAGELVLSYSYTDLSTRTTVTRRTVRKLISENEWIETAFDTRGGSERRFSEIRARRRP